MALNTERRPGLYLIRLVAMPIAISGCLVSMAAPSETVAKQFWHLSNRSAVARRQQKLQRRGNMRGEDTRLTAGESHCRRRDGNCRPRQCQHAGSGNSEHKSVVSVATVYC